MDGLKCEILGEQKEVLTFVEVFFSFLITTYFGGIYCLSNAIHSLVSQEYTDASVLSHPKWSVTCDSMI